MIEGMSDRNKVELPSHLVDRFKYKELIFSMLLERRLQHAEGAFSIFRHRGTVVAGGLSCLFRRSRACASDVAIYRIPRTRPYGMFFIYWVASEEGRVSVW